MGRGYGWGLWVINANHRYEVAPALRMNLLSKTSTSFPNIFLEGTPVFKMSQLRLVLFSGEKHTSLFKMQ